jgi:alkylation response protein AidB-like acyl-CoA dehydrogenase
MVDIQDFRMEVRDWLKDNAHGFESFDTTDPYAGRPFRRALWDAGFLGLTLSPDYGGQGLTSEHVKVFSEEASSYRLPPIGEPVTTGICAPTLLDFGTEDQKRRHLGPMIRGDEIWTQLLSEPGAGSDLAGLQTKATLDGDEYVLNGQKVWTSSALQSDYALCVARTDPTLPKHRGLSMLIVDLKSPGVTIRPIRQMTGEEHFNEVFLDDVHVPASALVGLENEGWRALTAMLTHERLALGSGTGAGGSGAGWATSTSGEFIEMARRRGLASDAVIRQDLAKLYIAEKVLAYLGQKMRDEIAAGIQVGPKGSIAKLLVASLDRQTSSLGMALAGPSSLAWRPDDELGGTHARRLCLSPMTAIAGGTSEIQRNTIGERVLGLPREPQIDRDLPFNDVAQPR